MAGDLDDRIANAVEHALSASTDNKRYIDLSRVPLICQSIVQISKDLKELREVQAGLVTQDQFWPVKTLVYGLLSLLLVGLVSFAGYQITRLSPQSYPQH